MQLILSRIINKGKNMKLHIYADSFGSFTHPDEHWQRSELPDENDFWQKALQVKLGCDELVNQSVNGTSLDFIQWRFKNTLNEISKDDYIIVIHTEPSRRWFIEDFPNVTNFQSFVKFPSAEINWPWIELISAGGIPSGDKAKFHQQVKVARDYCVFVANSELEDLYGSTIVSWFKEFQRQGYKLINIPAYNVDSVTEWNVNFKTTGYLESISIDEFVPDKNNDSRMSFIKTTQGQDGRVAHLSKVNHDILLDKIYNSFINNEDLELDKGFESNFITKDNWNDYNTYGVQPIPIQKKSNPY